MCKTPLFFLSSLLLISLVSMLEIGLPVLPVFDFPGRVAITIASVSVVP